MAEIYKYTASQLWLGWLWPINKALKSNPPTSALPYDSNFLKAHRGRSTASVFQWCTRQDRCLRSRQLEAIVYPSWSYHSFDVQPDVFASLDLSAYLSRPWLRLVIFASASEKHLLYNFCMRIYPQAYHNLIRELSSPYDDFLSIGIYSMVRVYILRVATASNGWRLRLKVSPHLRFSITTSTSSLLWQVCIRLL